MFDKIEEIIDMKDKLEEYKEEVNDYVLYDNEPFDNAYKNKTMETENKIER